MLCHVFILRAAGVRQHPDTILAKQVHYGWLAYNRPHPMGGAPETHAQLLAPDDRATPLALLQHASVARIDGVLLLKGFEHQPGLPQVRQSWICAADRETGADVVRKLPARPTSAEGIDARLR